MTEEVKFISSCSILRILSIYIYKLNWLFVCGSCAEGCDRISYGAAEVCRDGCYTNGSLSKPGL